MTIRFVAVKECLEFRQSLDQDSTKFNDYIDYYLI
jgi:hypothetical protein